MHHHDQWLPLPTQTRSYYAHHAQLTRESSVGMGSTHHHHRSYQSRSSHTSKTVPPMPHSATRPAMVPVCANFIFFATRSPLQKNTACPPPLMSFIRSSFGQQPIQIAWIPSPHLGYLLSQSLCRSLANICLRSEPGILSKAGQRRSQQRAWTKSTGHYEVWTGCNKADEEPHHDHQSRPEC
jgi:hypothetical protein